MPALVPNTRTLSGLYVSLRGVSAKSPYIIAGLVIKSDQKQTVSAFTCTDRQCAPCQPEVTRYYRYAAQVC